MNHPILIRPFVGLCAAFSLAFAQPPQAAVETGKFEKDRAAILAMAGAFKVDFSFQEILPLQKDYALKGAYHEEARELVKIVKDSGNQIILQHLLVVGSTDQPHVVKHWSQIWTFEDPSLLLFQGNDLWTKIQPDPAETTGTWSQLVTQTDDSPRYESHGAWTHLGETSEWVSQQTNRPLPRREYTKRDDYQILVAENRHLVTPEGWAHLQLNRKRVIKTDPALDLCLERGLNTYTRINPRELASAEAWWTENSSYWTAVREGWQEALASRQRIDLLQTKDGKTLNQTLQSFKRNNPTPSQVAQALSPYLR